MPFWWPRDSYYQGPFCFLFFDFEEEGQDGYDLPDHMLTRTVVSQRGKWWARQSLEAKKECWERARHYQTDQKAKHQKDRDELMSQLDDLLEKDKKEAEKHPPVCLSCSAVEEEDLERMSRLLQCPEFCSPKRIDVSRADLLVAPPPEDLPALPAGTSLWTYEEPAMPDWAKLIVKYRDFFRESMLIACDEGAPRYWKIAYGAQSPRPTWLCVSSSRHPFVTMGSRVLLLLT